MTLKVAINGYGRIGRQILRAVYEYNLRNQITIVAVNGSGDIATNAHLTRYDTTHGFFNTVVRHDEAALYIGEDRIPFFSSRDPGQLPWGDLGVDLVMECTGAFAGKAKSQVHLAAGAKKVLISAPGAEDVDATVVYGVNHSVLNPAMTVVSNASCTTNCLAPMIKPLAAELGVIKGLMTTVHAFTNDQVLIDVRHKDLRRARSAVANLIPTKTGAAKAIGLVIPQLKGKLDGFSVRVPAPNVSLVDLSFQAGRKTTAEEVNAIEQAAAAGKLKGILAYNTLPLVSSDFNHTPTPAIFDATLTKVAGGDLVKVLAWYDNEWSFACQMLNTARAMFQIPFTL